VADATAITGIIVSGLVGPSLGAWWARGQARSQDRRARQSDDLKELRVLLDEAMGHFDALVRRYGEFSAAWYTRETQPDPDTKTAMEDAYLALQATAVELFEMHSRFDARLGPDHPLSQGFGALRDDAQQLATSPGGVAMSFDRFEQTDRDAVREHGQAELALFVSRRREWIIESLPLAGLKLPNLEPPARSPG
jgi:hypothetical protein